MMTHQGEVVFGSSRSRRLPVVRTRVPLAAEVAAVAAERPVVAAGLVTRVADLPQQSERLHMTRDGLERTEH